MSDIQIKQVFTDLTSAVNKIEQRTAAILSHDTQVLELDIKELTAIYPKAKPFIQDSLPLLQLLPFSWARPLANIIILMTRIIDDIAENPPGGTTA